MLWLHVVPGPWSLLPCISSYLFLCWGIWTAVFLQGFSLNIGEPFTQQGLTHDLYSKPRSSRHDSSSASPNNDTLDFKSYGQTSQPVYAMCPGFLMIPDATGKQNRTRDHHRFHAGFGGADQGAREDYSEAQTCSELVIEGVQAPTRSAWQYFPFERCSQGTVWRDRGGISQHPARLSSLVRRGLTHSGALGFLG